MLCKPCKRYITKAKQVLHLKDIGYYDVTKALKLVKREYKKPLKLRKDLVKGFALLNIKNNINQIHARYHVRKCKKIILIGTENSYNFVLEGNHRITGFYLRKQFLVKYYFLTEEETKECFDGFKPPDGVYYQ